MDTYGCLPEGLNHRCCRMRTSHFDERLPVNDPLSMKTMHIVQKVAQNCLTSLETKGCLTKASVPCHRMVEHG